MLQTALTYLEQAFSRSGDELAAVQMALRTVLVYLATLVLVRVGSQRFRGKNTAFDTIIGIMLGSVMSRAINGSAHFLPTFAAGATMVAIHWLFAVIAFHGDRVGYVLKGRVRTLIEDGSLRPSTMRSTSITHNDLLEAARAEGKVTSLDQISAAFLERSGEISIIPKSSGPRVLEVTVADGVQTVRIEID